MSADSPQPSTSEHEPPLLQAKQLRPYVSVLLYDLRDARPAAEIVNILAGGFEPVIQSLHGEGKGQRLRSHNAIPAEQKGLWTIVGHWHELATPPSWLGTLKPSGPAAVLYDRHHHLTLFAVRASPAPQHPFGALLSTDPQVKKELVDILRKMQIPTVSRDELAVTFLRGASRQTWLRGVHRPVAVKADTKILAGLDLRDALDPVGDQSFTLDAALSDVRSERIMTDFRISLPETSKLRLLSTSDAVGKPPKKKRSDIVGLSLRQGTMWTRTSDDLDDFVRELDELCDQIQRTRETPPEGSSGYTQRGYRMLARPDIEVRPERLGRAVDFAFDLPLPSVDVPDDLPPQRVQALQEWREYGEFAVAEGDDSERLFVDAIYKEEVVGRIRLQPILLPRGRGDFNVSVTYRIGIPDEERDRLDYVLTDIRDRASIWFSNGYALQAGEVFNLQYRDVPFTGWKWMPFHDRSRALEYELDREKPAEYRLWEIVWNGRSLFEFIVNNVQSLFKPEGKEWYLLCDDGSGEIADFVFIDPARPRLQLIHVKAAGGHSSSEATKASKTKAPKAKATKAKGVKKKASGEARGIAPAKYEIVVSQATKNLRFLDPTFLADQLSKPLGKGRVRELTWTVAGQQKNREAAIAALRNMGAYFDRVVVVLQPHTTRKAWNAAEAALRANRLSDSDRVQLLRLRMMLADLEDVCRRFNATFEAWGDDDDPASSDVAFPRAALL